MTNEMFSCSRSNKRQAKSLYYSTSSILVTTDISPDIPLDPHQATLQYHARQSIVLDSIFLNTDIVSCKQRSSYLLDLSFCAVLKQHWEKKELPKARLAARTVCLTDTEARETEARDTDLVEWVLDFQSLDPNRAGSPCQNFVDCIGFEGDLMVMENAIW